jgi:hypothetical protein
MVKRKQSKSESESESEFCHQAGGLMLRWLFVACLCTSAPFTGAFLTGQAGYLPKSLPRAHSISRAAVTMKIGYGNSHLSVERRCVTLGTKIGPAAQSPSSLFLSCDLSASFP